MKVPKIVVHSDVLFGHLTTTDHPSVLRIAMRKFFCYTTVYQAVEVFAAARTDAEARAVENCMAAMKVLGMNPKNARTYGELLAGRKSTSAWNVLVAGLCIDSRLPLLTDMKREFKGIPGLRVVPTNAITGNASGAEILQLHR